MISPTCGSWIGAATWRVTRHGCVRDRPPGGLLGAAAGVGAAVEAPARGALVDLPRPLRDRLAQPGGVAAGVLHLVGVRRPVDATVGHPAGRQPGPAPAAELAAAPRHAGGVLEHLLEVDVLVELLELAGAGGRDRLLERVGERPAPARPPRSLGPSPSPGLGLSPAFTGSSGVASSAGARWRVGLADDSPVLAGRLVEPLELAVGDPHEPGVQVVERAEVVLAEHRAPQLAAARSGRPGRRSRSGCGPAGRRSRARRGRASAAGRAAASSSTCSANAGRITSTTAACSARRTNRPRSESGGNSRTPWASIRGSSSSRRSTASCRSAGSSDSDSAMSCSIAQRLVCLAWIVSCSATPKQRRIARRSSDPAAIACPRAEQRLGVEVDGARVDLDVTGVRQAGADQRPHRVQALKDQRPVVGEVLVDRVEPAALRGGAVQLLHEHRRPRREVVVAGVMRSPPAGSRAGSAGRCVAETRRRP